MADVHGFDHFQRSRGGGHSLPVAVVTAIDPVLRDALVASLLLDGEGVVELRYEVDAASAALRRLILWADGVIEDEAVDLEHPCVSCAMREDAVPTLGPSRRGSPVSPVRCSHLLSAPIPQSWWEPCIPIRTAGTSRAPPRSSPPTPHWTICSGTPRSPSAACNGPTGTTRSVGEALAAQIEYSDLVVVDGDPRSAGAELLEHLRAPDQRVGTTVRTRSDSIRALGG